MASLTPAQLKVVEGLFVGGGNKKSSVSALAKEAGIDVNAVVSLLRAAYEKEAFPDMSQEVMCADIPTVIEEVQQPSVCQMCGECLMRKNNTTEKSGELTEREKKFLAVMAQLLITKVTSLIAAPSPEVTMLHITVEDLKPLDIPEYTEYITKFWEERVSRVEKVFELLN